MPIWILRMFKCLTPLQDRQQLQSGQAISWYFIENWEGSWSGIRRTLLFVLGSLLLKTMLIIS